MNSMSPRTSAVNPHEDPVPTETEQALADRYAHEADGGDPDRYAAGWQADIPTDEVELEPIPRRAFLGAMLAPAALAMPSIPPLSGECSVFGERCVHHVLPPGRKLPAVETGARVMPPVHLGAGWLLVSVHLPWTKEHEAQALAAINARRLAG